MTTLDINKEQLQKMKTHPGFIAALDQSGGSTPKALRILRNQGRCVVQRRRDARDRASDAQPHYDQPQLQRRADSGCHPVREDHGQ